MMKERYESATFIPYILVHYLFRSSSYWIQVANVVNEIIGA